MALERGGVAEPSMALPTHLEALTGTLAACADKGRWQQCLPIAAALVGADAEAEADAAASVSPLPEMAEMTSRFPRCSRASRRGTAPSTRSTCRGMRRTSRPETRWRRLQSAGSPAASLGARSRLRLPQASASLG